MASNQVMADLAVRISTQTSELKKGLANAGNQVKAFGSTAKKQAAGFSKSFTGAFSSITGSYGPMVDNLIGGMKGMTGAFKGASGGAKIFKIALASTGVGVLVIALGALVTWLTSTKEGMYALSVATEVVQAVITAIVDTLSSMFRGFKKIIDGKFKEGFEDIGKSVAGLTDKMIANGKAGLMLAKMKDEASIKEIDNMLRIAELLEADGQLRIKSRDIDKYTAAERAAFTAEELKNTREIAKLKIEAIDDQIAILKASQDIGENLISDNKEMADLVLKRASESKALAGQEKELMMLGQGIRKEAAKAAAEKAAAVAQEKADIAEQIRLKSALNKLEATSASIQTKGIADIEAPAKVEIQVLKDKVKAYDEYIAKKQEQVTKEYELAQRQKQIQQEEAQAAAASQIMQQTMLDGITMIAEGIGKAAAGGLQTTGEFVKAFLGLILNFAKSFGKLLISLGVAKVSLEKIGVSGVGAIVAGAALIAISSAIGGLLNAGPGTEKMANGGIASGGLTMVGERGAEMVNLPQGSRVLSHGDMMSAARGGGAGVISVEDVIIRGEDLRIVLAEANRRRNVSV